MLSVSIIGVGRVGGALALALPAQEYSIRHLVSRSEAAMVSPDELPEIDTDVVFITTQDSEIENAVREILPKIRSSSVVFHTSGSYPSSILGPLSTHGCSIGSIHPLVSISKAETGQERFRGAYFCVEGDPEAVRVGQAIVKDLGGLSFCIDTQFKTLYHAAAVTACGHLVALFDAAVEMMTKCGLTAEGAQKILMPLVLSTVTNLSEQNVASALTGTFARADIETFTRHLAALNENVSDEILEIYLLLGERSLELAARQGVSPARIDTLRAKVTIAKSKLKW